MRRVSIIALVSCAGCSFQHGVAVTGDVPMQPEDAKHDSGSDSDAPSIDAPKVPVDAPPNACDTTDTSLRLCIEFDESDLATATTARDGSGLAHDMAIDNIAVASRNVPAQSQAAQLSSSSTIKLAQHADFDLQQFTVTAWIRRGASNPAQTQGVIDTGAQYALSIDTFGRVQCGITHDGTTTFPGLAQTSGNQWNLVACTYNGSNLCGYAFQNGSASPQTECDSYTQSVDTNAGYGTTIGAWAVPTSGSQFIGSVDQVRVYARALSQQELCTAAGISGC